MEGFLGDDVAGGADDLLGLVAGDDGGAVGVVVAAFEDGWAAIAAGAERGERQQCERDCARRGHLGVPFWRRRGLSRG